MMIIKSQFNKIISIIIYNNPLLTKNDSIILLFNNKYDLFNIYISYNIYYYKNMINNSNIILYNNKNRDFVYNSLIAINLELYKNANKEYIIHRTNYITNHGDLYIILYKEKNAGFFHIEKQYNIYMFNILYIIEEFRKLKLGSKAIEFILNKYNDYIIKAYVLNTNEPSKKLNEKYGFIPQYNYDNKIIYIKYPEVRIFKKL